MSKLSLYVPRLVASLEDRTLSGLLLPFGQPGHTNLGRITASQASRLDVAQVVTLNVQHDQTRPVGKAMTLETTPGGILASFHVLHTKAGDDALLEAAEGLRCGLSVEIEPVQVRDGQLVAGTITGAALVVEPAFPNARLAAAELPPVPDLGDTGSVPVPAVVIDGETLPDVETVEISAETVTITTATAAPANEPANLAASATTEGNTMTQPTVAPVAAAPAVAQVQNPTLVAAAAPANDQNALFAALAAGFAQGLTGPRLEAALSDVVPANILGIEQPQYVGQIWAGQPYERRIIPLFDHSDLNSFNITGWDWGTAPTVGLYTGNKTDIPSAAISTVVKSGVLQRIAGGHDIDRKFKDFSNTEFWAAYFAKMAESYAKVSDTYIRDQVVASIGAGAQRQHLLTGVAPAGVPTVLWQIVEGCVKMLDDLNVLPTFALVTSDYWKPLFYTKQNDVLAYLNMALGLKEGSLESGGFRLIPVPVGSLTNGAWVGKTVVGHKSALNVYELPGSPIRVSAEDIGRGGVDEALFGYAGYMLENAKGLISYDAPAAT